MPDYIITSKHYSPTGISMDYLTTQRDIIHKTRGVFLEINQVPAGKPVLARIERGQWIADCECGGATFVDPEWPYTFCFNCRTNGSHLRPVEFPENWKEIELTLLERPVNDMAGLTDNEKAMLSKPLIVVQGKGGLDRNWNPGETVEELHRQHDKPLMEWRKSLKGK